MGLNKNEAIRQLNSQGSISNQQALVKKIEGVQTIKPKKRIIPGGKDLSKLKPRDLIVSIYTWLRGCHHFTEVEISLTSDIENHKYTYNKVIDFDINTRNYEWELRGKRWLAERVVDVLRIKNILSVKIKKEGIYSIVKSDGTFGPDSEDWEPYISITPFKPPTF